MPVPLRPRQVEFVFGARQRHVVEALLLLKGFVINVAESRGHEHGLELKSLGGVHRHDLHAVALVLLLAQGTVLSGALVFLSPRTQELGEVPRREGRPTLLREQPVKDLTVCRPAAVELVVVSHGMRQRRVVHHALEKRVPVVLRRKLPPAVDEIGKRLVAVRKPGLEFGRMDVEEGGQEKRGEVAGPFRRGQEVEKRNQRLSLGRSVDSTFLVMAVGNPMLGQNALHDARPGAAPHEDAHVAVEDPVVVQHPRLGVLRPVRDRQRAQALHLPRGVFHEHRQAEGHVPVTGRAPVALYVRKSSRQGLQQRDGIPPRQVLQPQEPFVSLRIGDSGIVNPRAAFLHVAEPAGLRAKHVVERRDKRLGRAERRVQRLRRLRRLRPVVHGDTLLRREVRRHVRTLETVDGLLGIAHDEQESLPGSRSPFAVDSIETRREQASEDCPLPLVGVLELVDERDAVAAADGIQQRAARPLDLSFRLVPDHATSLRHQVVERQHGRFVLEANEHRPRKKHEVGRQLPCERGADTCQRIGKLLHVRTDVEEPHTSAMAVYGGVQLLAGAGAGTDGMDERRHVVRGQIPDFCLNRAACLLEAGLRPRIDGDVREVEIRSRRKGGQRTHHAAVKTLRLVGRLVGFRMFAQHGLRRRGEIVRRAETGGGHVGIVHVAVAFLERIAQQYGAHGAVDEVAVRAAEFHLHREAVLKGVFREDLAAERMDGADRRLVEIRRQTPRFREDVADAVLELARRLLGERDEQDVLDVNGMLLVRHQLQHDALERVRLTRPCGGFDDAVPVVQKSIPDGILSTQAFPDELVVAHHAAPPVSPDSFTPDIGRL